MKKPQLFAPVRSFHSSPVQGFVSRLAGPRNRVELPLLSAGASVVGSRIARLSGGRLFRNVGADEEYVFVNCWRRVIRNHQVHFAFLAEARIDLARTGV